MGRIKKTILRMVQLLVFLFSISSHADHVVLLHYVNRPETPAIPWIIVQGRFEMGMSMYPSKEKDNKNQQDFYIYLYDLKKDSSYDGDLKISIDEQETSFTHPSKNSIYEMSREFTDSGQHQLKVTVNLEGEIQAITLPFEVALKASTKNPMHLYIIGIIILLIGLLITFVKRRVAI